MLYSQRFQIHAIEMPEMDFNIISKVANSQRLRKNIGKLEYWFQKAKKEDVDDDSLGHNLLYLYDL